MNCPKCGTPVEAGIPFCGECGFQLIRMNQSVQAAQAPQTPQTNYARQVPQMSYTPQIPQTGYAQPMSQIPQGTYVPQQKKSNAALIIILLLAGLLLVIGIIIGILVFVGGFGDSSSRTGSDSVYSRDDDEEEDDDKEDEDEPVESSPETVIQEPEEPTAAPENVTEAEIEHTIMIYLLGSDLEHRNGFATMDIEEMVAADYGENTRIIIQTGGCNYWHIEGITGGEVERWELSDGTMYKLESLGAVRMLTPEVLADFITFSAENYPAEKYTLVMWDHGGGVPIGFGSDEMYPNDTLEDYQMKEALETAGVYFECIAFDACNMCTLEVAMSIKDYADYMVAAESTVVGYGMDYTSWLDYAGGDDADLEESYEIMAASYMDSLEGRQAASISLIDLGKIEGVYEAYVDYISSIHADVLNGGYEEYKLARANSGLYQNTESVDLITLANTYPNEESTALVNATVNAVHYTESDYAFGHGLAVYNPSEYISYYDYARDNMQELGYNEELLDFYDDVVTLGLAYLGTDYVDAYAGNWYNEELVLAYTGGGYEPTEETLALTQMDGYQAIALSENDWSIVEEVETTVFAMNEEQTVALVLGSDNVFSTDDNGYIIVEQPEQWTFVNGCEACFITVDYWEDSSTGEWSQTGAVCATLDGEPIMILVYYNNEHPSGVIQGYYYYDFNTGEGEMEILQFAEDDIVEIVLPYYTYTDEDDVETGYINLSEESFYASDLYLDYNYVDLSGTIVCVQYEITDVYENVYSTEWVSFY